ncbi:hypothetical protein HPB49_006159 [Dermacentor silvarum]|uniref:Uncharacterized protein n=1 Tax=Dermacentor silvarum TaxID=543639 RepID=A0ACB8DVI1_DERSI|nr:hypothetical protein HPB49_006159 [Dermacentor silvarum]
MKGDVVSSIQQRSFTGDDKQPSLGQPDEEANKTSSLSHLKCQFTQYVANQHLSRLQIYNFIGLIWGMFFIVGLGQVALAAAFASYYWAFRKPQDVPFFAVLHGLWITVRYAIFSLLLMGSQANML